LQQAGTARSLLYELFCAFDKNKVMFSFFSKPVMIPRLSLKELDHAAFARAMTETGFVVLTDIGECEKLHSDMMSDFAAFVACSAEEKKQFSSRKVYKNERNVPMWYCGYEGEQMREAFRLCSGIRDFDVWPSDKFRERWTALSSFLQNLCDRCLGILLERDMQVTLNSTQYRRFLSPIKVIQR
jgi:hypothetical protein